LTDREKDLFEQRTGADRRSDNRTRQSKLVLILVIALMLVGTLVAHDGPAAWMRAHSMDVHAESLADKKPELRIYFYHNNPCSSCPTVSDFQDKVSLAVEAWDERISFPIFVIPTYTTDGMAQLQQLLDQSDVPQNNRYHNEYVLIGKHLLKGETAINTELASVLASEVQNILENDHAPEPTVSPMPTPSSMVTQPTIPIQPLPDTENTLIFISSASCENCRKADILVLEIDTRTDIEIIRYDVQHDANEFRAIIDQYQIKSPAVPIIIFQDKVWVGYNAVIVSDIRTTLGLEDGSKGQKLFLWDVEDMPIVFSTVLIGLTDGFNPCSLWALLFLISMVLRFKSRKFMLIVGFTYIFVVALVYGLFIFGLFGIVTYFVDILWLRIVLFLLSFIFGAANVYSFFSDHDPFISISTENKKRFILNIRNRLYKITKLPGLVAAVVVIALLASLIELPCTAGFPVIWNAIMAEQTTGLAVYLSLLALYLLMYILDELIIVAMMVVTMSKMYMNQSIGRSLKLISGLLMAYLAILLLLDSKYLNNMAFMIGGSIAVIVVATGFAWIYGKIHRKK